MNGAAVLGRPTQCAFFLPTRFPGGLLPLAVVMTEQSRPLPRVLLVEDQAVVLLSLVSILEEAGYDPSSAATAGEALALLDANAFDVAVLDLGPPDGNSFALATALAQREIPFCFCTGSDVEMLPPFDGVPTIDKPFTDAQLIGAVAKLLQPR